MLKFLAGALCGLGLLVTSSAQAHFQLIYSPKVTYDAAEDVALKLVFWHPFENGYVMDMAEPQEFSVYFRGEKTDLKPTLKESTFQGLDNTAKSFDAHVSLKRSGDYHLTVTPEPYLEESEDIYIQQITKVILNNGGVPSDWFAPLGLKAEIVPLGKPYGAIAGSSFRGIVLQNGKPVPGAKIEVEHMTSEPDMNISRTSNQIRPIHPGGAITILADPNGVFSFTMPKSGFWGFAALGVGPEREFNGKELSQDAVIWVKAHPLGE